MAGRRAKIEIHGAVQGVGFRPFVYRLATTLGITGWVLNDAHGVFIEAEGDESTVVEFVHRLGTDLPDVASIDTMDVTWDEPTGSSSFDIRHSEGAGAKTAVILPDLATCRECLADVIDPGNRRHAYPFTNCTNCGPRFSIIVELPYDRPNTTMHRFTMCDDCAAEYADPADRRFHAQPNACPVCGPTVTWTARGVRARGMDAIAAAAGAIRHGATVALKGIGGYQLTVDATDGQAVHALRTAKQRPAKPLAVMVPDLEEAAAIVDVDEAAASLLMSSHAPIVLLPRAAGSAIADIVAPGNPTLGVMLPTTPLHHLILREVDRPIVATSGNLTDEPIAIDDGEAMERLGDIADGFLSHDRPIERHVDDSVTWIVDGQPRLLRRARGYAPMPVTQPGPLPPILATGAHLKNTIAVSVERNVFVSQHIGDLETEEAYRAFTRVIDDLVRIYDVTPEGIAHDLHPDYLSTRYVTESSRWVDVPAIAVQHHHAHLVSCLADNDRPGPALGVTWDGTGYGTDGTIWGGEFLLGDATGFERVAHLRPFLLPGGEAAVREPRRTAAALLWDLTGELRTGAPGLESFSAAELRILESMMARRINTPVTTSAGRLFDAVAALVGLRTVTTFEGEAAMALEYACSPGIHEPFPIDIDDSGTIVVDWRPTITGILDDVVRGEEPGSIAARFHATLVEAIARVAARVGHPTVALTGGCFQNRILTELTARRLREDGFDVLLHRRVPPNDGGISLGQIVVAAARIASGSRGPGTVGQ